MIVREPNYDDVNTIFEMILPYAAESWQGRNAEVDYPTIVNSLFNVIGDPTFIKLIVENEGEIVAFACGYTGISWWKEPDGCIDMFYVSKKARGTKAARELVAGMINRFKSAGVGYLYAGAESDVNDKNTRLYENLFKKFGFRDIGGGSLIINLRGI